MKKILFIIIAVAIVVYLLINHEKPWHSYFLEYFLFFIGGFLIVRFPMNEERKNKIVILILLGIIIAMFWDPLIAPYILPGKTVPELIPSIILNGISLITFLVSYFIFKYLIKRGLRIFLV